MKPKSGARAPRAVKPADHGAQKSPGPGTFVIKGNARYDRHDHYYKEAKREGYVARSIYKLDEIDAKFKLLRKNDAVLDLGCAPGSWMQFACERVGDRGVVVGIDLLKAKVAMPGHGRVMIGDAFDTPIDALQPAPDKLFDVVLSDMAPNTSGIRTMDQARSLALCERALEVASYALRQGGHFCVKIFEGGEQKTYLTAVQALFKDVDVFRPKSTREGSKETFVVARHKKTAPRKIVAIDSDKKP